VCRGLVIAWLSANGDLNSINQAQVQDAARITDAMESADLGGYLAVYGLIQVGDPLEGEDLGNPGKREEVLKFLCQPGYYFIGLHNAEATAGHALGAIKKPTGGSWFDPNNSQNVLSSDALYRRSLEYIIKLYVWGKEYKEYIISRTSESFGAFSR